MLGLRVVCLGGVAMAVACREPNPNFVEAPDTSDADASGTTGSSVPPTTGPTTTSNGAAETTSSPDTDDTVTVGDTTGQPACEAGEVVCQDGYAQVCDGMGGFTNEALCSDVCVPGLGCAACQPQSTGCAADVAQVCNDAGVWEFVQNCDPLQGLACSPDQGVCLGACAAGNLQPRQEGCDFYAVTLPNDRDQFGDDMTLALLNPEPNAVMCTITRGGDELVKIPVPPVDMAKFFVERDPMLAQFHPNAGDASLRVTNGAYRIRCTGPIVAYQYDPGVAMDSTPGDASLLLPTHTWRSNYIVATMPHNEWAQKEMPGFYAVVGRDPDTTVTLLPSATGTDVAPGPGIAASGEGVADGLLPGEVLLVLSTEAGDLTGTRIAADRPVGVFSGHKCIAGEWLCDHVQVAVPPVATLGTRYIVPPVNPEGSMTRVIATQPATLVTTTEDNVEMVMLDEIGDFFDLWSYEVLIEASKPVLVAHFGQPFGGSEQGMRIAVAETKYLSQYFVYASTGYQTAHRAVVVAPNGTQVFLNGDELQLVEMLDGSYLHGGEIMPMATGPMRLTGTAPFEVSVYGYSSTSAFISSAGQSLE